MEIFDCGLCRGVKLVFGGGDTDVPKMSEIVGDALRGIVRQKRVTDTQLLKESQKRLRRFKECPPPINRSIHVQCDMPNSRQTFFHCSDSAQSFQASLNWATPRPTPQRPPSFTRLS